MAEPQSEDDGVLREWAPLSEFLREVPLTVRRGLFLETVTLTCIDALPEYLAVGTNIGVVYWYHRETHRMQRLRPEKSTYKITCVKVVSSVYYMVAAGDESGTVTVFRIPKPTPNWITPAYKKNSTNNVERYTVGGLHSAAVSALEWSINGQKLYSGDSTGLVVFTEIDFYMNLSKACEILNEKYRIVQLSFNQNTQTLVVATEYRCIVAHKQESGCWGVVQIGQQERRSLCQVGATFFPHPENSLERIVYSGRAGLRFWQADIGGFVQKTLIFKDAINNSHQHIQLLQPVPVEDTSWDGDLGPILAWKDKYLISYNTSALVVLDPQNISVVASLTGLTELHSVSVTVTEIFFITGTRNIVRLSYAPDAYRGKQESPISMLELKVSPVADSFLNFTSKLKNTATQLMSSRPANGSMEEGVQTGTEALELDLPPVLPLDTDVLELTLQLNSRIQILDQIGKQSFDNVLYSSTKKVNRKKNKKRKSNKSENEVALEMSSGTISEASVKSEEESSDGEPNTRPSSRNNNQPPEQQLETRLTLDLVSSSGHLATPIPPDILPDLRSPDSIQKDVHDKEILVAKAFNLEEVLLNEVETKSEKENTVEACGASHISEQRKDLLNYGPPSGSSSAIPSLEPPNSIEVQDSLYKTQEGNEDVDMKKEVIYPFAEDISNPNTAEATSLEYNDGWSQISIPETAQYLSICRDYICISGPSRILHIGSNSPVLKWKKLNYRAVELVISPASQLVWKIDFGVAAALTDIESEGLLGSSWEIAARGVESVALSDICAWYVSAGKIYLQLELSRSKPFCEGCLVSCPAVAIKVCCSHTMVWVLTVEYWVLWRAGITDQCLEGTHWQRVNLPQHLEVADISLGPCNVGWIIDRSNSIYFSDNHISEGCSWWQVVIRNYLFENSCLCQISSDEHSVWVTNRVSPYIYMNATSIKGHRWVEVLINNLTVPLRWRQITAEGVFEEKGSFWLLSSANDLFHLRPGSDNVKIIALPCNAEDVSSVSAAPHALWLLTHSGQIYVRQGMGDQCPEGEKWRTLNLEQISDKQVTLRHVSCGCDIIWACDTKGDMYMAVGSPYLIATDTFSPAWVQVDGTPLSNTYFIQVFVGSETHIVWALDNKNHVYVRSGIFHDFQLGTDWVVVSGLLATELTISGSAVWALSTNGSVFCRIGISENNYIGNYWYQLPGSLCHITASLSEGLWGVSDKNASLVVYSSHDLPLSETAKQAVITVLDRDDDWEVI